MRLIVRLLMTATLCIAVSTSYSQNLIDVTEDILIVYQRDGVTTQLLKSDVDSMKLSNIDVDSVVCQSYVVQEIITPDSIYRIALSKIDSISLQPAPTRLNPGVIDIEANDGYLRSYVLGCELGNSHIYFSNWLPEAKLPPVGSIIYARESKKYNIPYGFYGKIKSITNTGSKYDVECEDVSLDEVYETYCRAFIYDAGNDPTYYPFETLMPDDEANVSALIKTPGFAEEYIGAPINFPQKSLDFNEEAFKLSISPVDLNFMGEPVSKTIEELRQEHDEDYKSEKETGLYGNLSTQTSLAMKLFATKLGTPFYVSGMAEVTVNNSIHVGYQGKIEKERKFRRIWQTPRPYYIPLGSGIFIELSADLSLIGRFEGEGGAQFGGSQENKILISFSLCKPGTSPRKNELHFMPGAFHPDLCTLYGEMKLEGGLRLSLNIAPWTKHLVHTSLYGEAGIRAIASASMNALDITRAKTSTDLYRCLRDDNAVRIEGYVKGDVSMGALFDRFYSDLDIGPEWTRTIWKGSLMSSMTKLERYNLQHIRYDFESEPFLDRVIRVASTNGYYWELKPFFSIKDITPGTKHPHDFTLNELNDKTYYPNYGFNHYDKADITITSYNLNPLHMYEVTPYALLTKMIYPTDMNEEPRYEYYPIMIDEAKRFDIPYIGDMSANYSYLFRQNSTNRHMLNIKIPNPDLKPSMDKVD